MSKNFAIGVDFGTESGRAVLVDLCVAIDKDNVLHAFRNELRLNDIGWRSA